jgi:hypothetical protein
MVFLSEADTSQIARPRQRFIVEFDAAACSDETDFATHTRRSSCTQVRMKRCILLGITWPRPECPFFPFFLPAEACAGFAQAGGRHPPVR